jgi:hypothetical protein
MSAAEAQGPVETVKQSYASRGLLEMCEHHHQNGDATHEVEFSPSRFPRNLHLTPSNSRKVLDHQKAGLGQDK